LRAKVTDRPRLISQSEIQPPEMPPTKPNSDGATVANPADMMSM
jgi:hypothetical protein